MAENVREERNQDMTGRDGETLARLEALIAQLEDGIREGDGSVWVKRTEFLALQNDLRHIRVCLEEHGKRLERIERLLADADAPVTSL